MLAQQNGFVSFVYRKQYTQFNTGNIWHTKAALRLKVHYPDILNVSGVFASLEEKGSQTAITVNEGFCLDWISSVGHKRASPLRQTFIPGKAHIYRHKHTHTHKYGAKKGVSKVLWCWVMSLYLNDHWWQTHKASFEEACLWNARAATLSPVIIG